VNNCVINIGDKSRVLIVSAQLEAVIVGIGPVG
jgi:hypothetical protein